MPNSLDNQSKPIVYESPKVVISAAPLPNNPSVEDKSDLLPTSNINNRAAELRAQIKKAEAEKAALNIEITTEGVQKIWKQYSQNHSSKSIQTALNTSIVELIDNSIFAYTPTNYIKELISHESKLMEEIRASLHKDDLILQVKVDLSKFPDYKETSAVKTRLSNKEIYKNMAEKNPLLTTMMSKLKLKLDGEI